MLETKIEELTKAVQELTIALNAEKPEPKKAETKKEEKPEPKKESKPDQQKPSRDDVNQDLQAKALEMIRNKKVAKPQITKLIADHGGKLIKDIPEENIEAFKKELEALNG